MSDRLVFDPVEDLTNRKKSPWDYFKKSFIHSDLKTLKRYAWKRKIVPFIMDLVLSSIAMVFYENGNYKSSSYKYVDDSSEDYTKYSRSSSKYSYITDDREYKHKTETDEIPHYQDLPPVTPEKADRVIRTMKEALKSHKYISVDSFYTLFKYTSTDPIDQKWGWDYDAFASATTAPGPRGLVKLIIPDAIPIKLR